MEDEKKLMLLTDNAIEGDDVLTLLKDIQGQLANLTQVIDTMKPVEEVAEEVAEEVTEEVKKKKNQLKKVDLKEIDGMLQED